MNDHGFLADEAADWAAECRRRHAPWFDIVERLNREAHRFMLGIEFRDDDRRGLLCAALMIRSLSAFQAIIVLSMRGFVPETQVLLRNLLEIRFTVGAVARDPGFVDELVKSVEVYKLQRCKTFQKSNLPETSPQKQWATKDKLDELQRKVDEQGGRDYTVRDRAERAELLPEYLGAYSYFSNAAHVNLLDLSEKHLPATPDGYLSGIRWGPSDEDLGGNMATAAYYLLDILDDLGDIYKVLEPSTLRTLKQEFDSFVGRQFGTSAGT